MQQSSIIQSLGIDINSLEAKAETTLAPAERQHYKEKIKQLLARENAVLIAHYYTDADLQELAESTGGFVGDSLQMAQFGQQHEAETIIVSGVRFMGETAKILSPEKRVLMPTLEAECSLDLSCPEDDFKSFCQEHSDRTVVVYANTSAAVKAAADWVVTSSIGLDIVNYLNHQGEKILWAPDRHLGEYIRNQTQADMLMWNGVCIVHDAFKSNAIRSLKTQYPDAAVLVHPESPSEVIEMADLVGSTSALIHGVKSLPNEQFIVATDRGIFYKMQQICPTKTLIEVPTGGKSATCVSCAHCPWMAMNHLDNLAAALEEGRNEVLLDQSTIEKARLPLERMLNFAKEQPHLKLKDSV